MRKSTTPASSRAGSANATPITNRRRNRFEERDLEESRDEPAALPELFTLHKGQPLTTNVTKISRRLPDQLQVYDPMQIDLACPLLKRFEYQGMIGQPGMFGMALRFTPKPPRKAEKHARVMHDSYVMKLQAVRRLVADTIPTKEDGKTVTAAYNEMRIYVALSRLIRPSGRASPTALCNFIMCYDWTRCDGKALLDQLQPVMDEGAFEMLALMARRGSTRTRGRQDTSSSSSSSSSEQAVAAITKLGETPSKSVVPTEEDADLKHGHYFPMQVIVMEEAAGTLGNLLRANPGKFFGQDVREFKTLIIQIAATLHRLQRLVKFTHWDMHVENILYVRPKDLPTTIAYGGIVLPTTGVAINFNPTIDSAGRIYKLADFGYAYIAYRDAVEGPEEIYSVRTPSPLKSELDCANKQGLPILTGVFNPSYDLHRLGCDLFVRMLEEAIDGALSLVHSVNSQVFLILSTMINANWRDAENMARFKTVHEALLELAAGRGVSLLENVSVETLADEAHKLGLTAFGRFTADEEWTPLEILLNNPDDMFDEFMQTISPDAVDMNENLALPHDWRAAPIHSEMCAECETRHAQMHSSYRGERQLFCSQRCSDEFWS